jgi:hypothetical protein
VLEKENHMVKLISLEDLLPNEAKAAEPSHGTVAD